MSVSTKRKGPTGVVPNRQGLRKAAQPRRTRPPPNIEKALVLVKTGEVTGRPSVTGDAVLVRTGRISRCIPRCYPEFAP